MPREGKDLIADTYTPDFQKLDELKYFQEYEVTVLSTNNVFISTLAMDFPSHISTKKRKAIDEKWKAKFPELTHIKSLNLRHRVTQDYFEAICKMKSLESLNIWTSNLRDISSIRKLNKLKSLSLNNFSQLENISPIVELKSLESLYIMDSFKISDYELIGEMTWLKSLTIGGDQIAPRNLMIESLEPFTELSNLVHLDLSYTSIRDKKYRPILNLNNLKRLDAHWRMKNEEREFLQKEHPSLKSGSFVAYDFVKNEFKKGIEWWIE